MITRKITREVTDFFYQSSRDGVFIGLNKERLERRIKWSMRFIDDLIKEQEEIITNIPLNINDELETGRLKLSVSRINKLNKVRKTFLWLNDLYERKESITAKQIRSKRNHQEDPAKDKARDIAKKKWEQRSKTSLLDMAFTVKQELNINKGATTIQEWIRDLNPNAKSRKPK